MKKNKLQRVEPESVLGIPHLNPEFWFSERQHHGGVHIVQHSHADFIQLIFIVEGCATFYFQDRMIIASKGHAVFIPRRAEHGISISRKTVLRTLSLFAYEEFIEHNQYPFQFQTSALVNALAEEIAQSQNQLPATEQEERVYQVFIDKLNAATRKESSILLPDDVPVRKAIYRLTDVDSLNIPLSVLCKEIGVSERTLTRLFIAATGVTFSEYKKRIQMEYAMLLVADGMPIIHVALQVGYATQSSFIHAFKKQTGLSPLQYRKQRPPLSDK